MALALAVLAAFARALGARAALLAGRARAFVTLDLFAGLALRAEELPRFPTSFLLRVDVPVLRLLFVLAMPGSPSRGACQHLALT
jgi:hypothetical protein